MNNEQSRTDQNRKESYMFAYGSAICLVVTILYMSLIYSPQINNVVIHQQNTIDSLKDDNIKLVKTIHLMSGWGYIRDNATDRDINEKIYGDKKERVQFDK